MDNEAVATENVTKTFNEGTRTEVTALRDVTLRIQKGECVALQGPSGSGKTTLLSLIGCMSRPTSGRVRVGGEDTSRLPERFLTLKRRREVGVVFQHFNLVEDLTALRNVALPLVPTGLPRRERSRRARALLNRFGLGDRADFETALLSGGEKQRVALARALVNDPALVIADEPTAHLDTAASRRLMTQLAALKKEGRTLVIATHDPLVTEQAFVDRAIRVRDGEVVP